MTLIDLTKFGRRQAFIPANISVAYNSFTDEFRFTKRDNSGKHVLLIKPLPFDDISDANYMWMNFAGRNILWMN